MDFLRKNVKVVHLGTPGRKQKSFSLQVAKMLMQICLLIQRGGKHSSNVDIAQVTCNSCFVILIVIQHRLSVIHDGSYTSLNCGMVFRMIITFFIPHLLETYMWN